ncbi:hypothetical protein HK097_008498 [Rhizophlyctis rosea]|uniref:SH3 domain-containing protein n=1 Tax=Rhizophlyctis rosea TaxID=64517 RepID=A0AAD5SI78_9FUNG|nr:hypothetical protein HK097_008498 [Rhizophlyctis rosea]
MVNSPIPGDLTAECRKAAKIIEQFVKPEKGVGPDQLIPPHIIANAKGLAVLSVLKAGFLFSGRAGSGLVIARLDDGSWSAPSAIATAGMGMGGQIGAELTDFVIILNTKSAVKAFSHGGNVTLGGNLSVAAGPIGRNAEAGGAIGNFAAIYSYSKTRGLFAGVSIEGSAIIERKDANAAFYHRKVSAGELLTGAIPAPPAAEALYRALNRRATGGDPYDTYSAGGPTSGTGAGYSNSYQNQIAYMNQTQDRPASYGAYGTAVQPGGSSLHNSSGGGFLAAATQQQSTPAPYRASAPPPPTKRADTAIAQYDFAGERDGDLSFRKGDVIVVTQKTGSVNDWWTGRCNGREGMFPANYVTMQ